MRKGYSLLLLLLCYSWVSAQNWAPINTTDKYNYKLDTASVISHTLWVDSVTVSGNDMVYWMNRIVKAVSDSIALKNQPQFLQKQVVVKLNGSYNFAAPSNIGYAASLALGDNVVYDSTNNITARVIAVDTTTVLSNSDSVKVLLLSSGDTVIVSKSYGFVQYPDGYASHRYYWLVGIEGGRSVGELVPQLFDFFDFHVGDVFEYKMYAFGVPDASPYISTISKTQIMRITDKQITNDSIVYSYHMDYWDSTLYYYYGMHVRVDSADASFTIKNISNDAFSYPNTTVVTGTPDYYLRQGMFNSILYPCSYPFGFVTVGESFKDFNGRTVRLYERFYINDTSSNASDTLVTSDFSIVQNMQNEFVTGLGQVNYNFDCFEHGAEGQLIAYQTASDTLGIIDTVPYVGIFEINNQFVFSIQPNPISNQLNIALPEPTTATIRIFNLNGTEIITQQSQGSSIEINTSILTAGVYIVEVHTKDGVARKKVVKM